MASGMFTHRKQNTQAQPKKRIRAIRTRVVLFTQRLILWIQQYLSTRPSPPEPPPSEEAPPPPFIDEVPTEKQELPRTPSGRLPSEEQLFSMYRLGKEEGKRETLAGPLIHKVATPIAPLCEVCLKEGLAIPLWHDPISPYETYSYCTRCAAAQGKHYPPIVSDAHPVDYAKLQEQLAVRRILLRHEEASLAQNACLLHFTPLPFGQETAAQMQTVHITEEAEQFLNDQMSPARDTDPDQTIPRMRKVEQP